MYNMCYKVVLESGETVSGSIELTAGANHLVLNLPQGKIKSARAELGLSLSQNEKIFMNGYQSWTYCPEYSASDFTRGIGPLPNWIIRHFGVDRYGDYHFVNYPQKRGVTHGESYCYFRLGGSYRLFASLDESPGYTLFCYNAPKGILSIERDCAGIICGGEYHAFDLYLSDGSEDEVFDGWFDALGVKPRTTLRRCGYSSWYYLYRNICYGSLAGALLGSRHAFRSNDVFQIDDGWQPAIGDWLECDREKFPNGMRDFSDEIHVNDYVAGLWLAPFVCQRDSKLFKEHPDWLLRVNGEPWYNGCNWGGFYSLDIDNPEVVEYLDKVFRRVFVDWNFDLVKLDFLYAAAPFGSETETRAARMIRAMELLRRLCGNKLILGCGVPLMPAFGLVDYCRIGCDVGFDWNNNIVMRHTNRERVSTLHSIGNTVFRRQLNGRAFMNDPDVFFLRKKKMRLSKKHKEQLATVNALLGGLFLTSDDMFEYNQTAHEQFRHYRSIFENAENIRVDADCGIRISYTLSGEEHTVVID